MTDNPEAQDFNWVRAKLDALPSAALDSIRKDVRAAVEERNASLEEIDAAFRFALGDAECVGVILEPAEGAVGSSRGAHFELLDDGRIKVSYFATSPQITLPPEITAEPVLDPNGSCRFLIDGGEGLLRWQFIRQALEPLLFPDALQRQFWGI